MGVRRFLSWLVGEDELDGLANVGHPPLDPSTALRVSGPTSGDGFPIGVGNDGVNGRE